MVFAMANPEPEVMPEEAAAARAHHRHGPLRLPEPDQQRAVLPRAVPRCARRARRRDHRGDEAGRGVRDRRGDLPAELSEEYIIPSVFDRRVAEAVAAAVAEEARRAGDRARRRRPAEVDSRPPACRPRAAAHRSCSHEVVDSATGRARLATELASRCARCERFPFSPRQAACDRSSGYAHRRCPSQEAAPETAKCHETARTRRGRRSKA